MTTAMAAVGAMLYGVPRMRLERDASVGPSDPSAFVGPSAARRTARARRGAVGDPLAGDPLAGDADETELAARLAAGDESALAALYDAYAPRIHALALRILATPQDAEEVVLDAFMQAWREAPRYDPARGTLGAWLVLIARSRALDRLRARGRRDRTMERARVMAGPVEESAADAPAAPPASGARSPDPARDVERQEEDARVRSALEALPPAVRQALELAFFEGLTHSEIASRLGWPLGTVKTRVRGGLLKLREALAPLRDDTA
jgi:RNA polymerase sigma-70 factor (ECF subfamily)